MESPHTVNRRRFMKMAGATIVAAGGTAYVVSDKRNVERRHLAEQAPTSLRLLPDEEPILHLASLAPNGHNTQPWLVKHVEPYHWIVSNDKTRWLGPIPSTPCGVCPCAHDRRPFDFGDLTNRPDLSRLASRIR